LLCLAFIAAWVRSHQTTDLVVWSGSAGRYDELVTIPGQFRWTRVTNWVGNQPLRWISNPNESNYAYQPVFGQQVVRGAWLPIGIGFDGGSRRINSPIVSSHTYKPITVAYRITAVPFALPVLVTGVVVLWPLLRKFRHRRISAERRIRGLCSFCGYDVRATPGRCPECGRPSPKI